ncbi:MAG TPA: hypothetical protein VEJ46_05595 [Candidatus Acidoferrum sp.]|nr:hypothetical protein [Candidatus Acidoferrum sp.]
MFFWLKWKGLDLSVKVADLPGLLAPVAFAAAVIERAVEILVSPWRDAGASKLQRALDSIKARPAYPASNVQNALDQQNASNALDDYRGQTQRYAFAVSLILSTLVSIAGVRVLWPFVNQVKFSDKTATSLAQQIFFLAVDVLVSAALLAGGADGIHSVVNAVTTFFESTADRTSKPTS